MRDEIDRPVDVVRLLKASGLTLRGAHEVLESMAQGNSVPVTLNPDRDVSAELDKLGVEACVVSEPAPAAQ